MMYSNEWPLWVKAIVITSIVVVALGSIWGQVRDSRILRAVARELLAEKGDGHAGALDKAAANPTPPGEATVKGMVSKAAEDSATAVQMLDNFKDEYKVKHEELERRVAALELEGTHGRDRERDRDREREREDKRGQA